MIGIIAAAAIALAGNYGGAGVVGGGASCGATTVPVLELGSVVCEAPSQILAQPTLFAPQVGYAYPQTLSPWYGGYGGGLGFGLGGHFGGGLFGGGLFGGGHHGHLCTTTLTTDCYQD